MNRYRLLIKLKNNQGGTLAIGLFALLIIFILFYISMMEFEHNVYVEQKDRFEDALRAASKAAVMQINKGDADEEDPSPSYYDSTINTTLESDSKVSSEMIINKANSNGAIEKIICNNAVLVYEEEKSLLRKHLILRGYSEPRADGSILLTLYDNQDYGGNLTPEEKLIPKADTATMKQQIENALNSFITAHSVGQGYTLNLINTDFRKPIPEVRIDVPCIFLFLQDYPVKTWLKQRSLNVIYLSPAILERKADSTLQTKEKL